MRSDPQLAALLSDVPPDRAEQTMRVRVESFGLKLTALENVPTRFCDHIMRNGLRRDEQIENMIDTVRNIARAGIPIIGYCQV